MRRPACESSPAGPKGRPALRDRLGRTGLERRGAPRRPDRRRKAHIRGLANLAVEGAAILRIRRESQLKREFAGYGTIVFLTLAAGSTAMAQSGPPPPVTIDRCAPIINNNSFTQPSPMPLIAGLPLAQTSSGMRISFVNDANKVANLVNLRSFKWPTYDQDS